MGCATSSLADNRREAVATGKRKSFFGKSAAIRFLPWRLHSSLKNSTFVLCARSVVLDEEAESVKALPTAQDLSKLTSKDVQNNHKNSTGTDVSSSPEIGTDVGNSQRHQEVDMFNDKGGKKERRLGYGIEVVREQIRRMAIGGPQSEADKANLYAVSSSDGSDAKESETDDRAQSSESNFVLKPPAVVNTICEALSYNQVFRGIQEASLMEVVQRMVGVSFRQGATILQQGAPPKDNDSMYFLEAGDVDVVISGDTDSANHLDNKTIKGNVVIVRKTSGWVFGDVSLLFNTPRTASVVAFSNCTLWTLDKRTFSRFVMRQAKGARMLRFVRKLPLLKGLSDNALLSVAAKMQERMYVDGEPLIRYGESGNELYLIRHGKVRVLRPTKNGIPLEVAVLGRGQFVGERTLITGKLRSADCVACGPVSVVVINKKDFWDLDNPLLAWMLDYDAVTCVLKNLPPLLKLHQDAMEEIMDRFDGRVELCHGDVIIQEGQLVEKLFVIKSGDVSVTKCEKVVDDLDFLKEAGGFSYFGESVLHAIRPSPVTVTVESDSCQILALQRRQLDDFLGSAQGASQALTTKDVTLMLTQFSKQPLFQVLENDEVLELTRAAELYEYQQGDVVCWQGDTADKIFMIKNGRCVITNCFTSILDRPDIGQPVNLMEISGKETGELRSGDVYGERVLLGDVESWTDTVIVSVPQTAIYFLTKKAVTEVLGSSLGDIIKKRTDKRSAREPLRTLSDIRFDDLEQHRIVGTGQFGLVRLVRHATTNKVYALKVMHKATIQESKQAEHVVNERKILEEADHTFCVGLVKAYQDETSLYLLQEWVPGGELFHHLDLEGSFDEATAMFYAANVILALEFLHSKGIIYRDLKPENLLLDVHGYIKVADFGFAKRIGSETTFTICGTPDYQAPEVIMRRGTDKAADYWALGVLIFEMLVGDPPFKSMSGDPWDTFRRTLSGRFYVPNFISSDAADLIYKLLQVNPERRLGSGKKGAADIKAHRWFAQMDWDALEHKRLTAPIRPRVRNPLDTSNFDVFDAPDSPPAIPHHRQVKTQEWDALWEWVDEF